ncbi:MAG: ABC transporter permease [Faecalibacterium sp.]|jgi:simple sugar transport system permease protein|nr:ABC transporter permease [Faecalibacterium sp.]
MKNAAEHNAPLLRIAKRDDVSPAKAWCIRIASIFVALLLSACLIMITGFDPFSVYAAMVKGSLGSPLAIQQTIKLAIPLLGAAIAIAPAFKMKFWNIGVEGQITMGAVFSTFFALSWYNRVPSALLLVLMALAGMLGGGLWGLIPAVFRARWGTNETLFTLMLNYIAIGIVKYLQGGPWEKKPRGTQQIGLFQQAARLPTVWGVTIGIFVILLLVVLMFCYLKYTKHGYEISVVGESEPTARYAGIQVPKVVRRTMFLSGAVAGLVGFIMVSGINYTLSDSVAGGAGFTGITVAWLAQLNTFAMVIISFLLAILEKGASTINTLTHNMIPESMSDMVTGMILFCMLGSEFFIRYRLIWRKKQAPAAKAENGKEAAV